MQQQGETRVTPRVAVGARVRSRRSSALTLLLFLALALLAPTTAGAHAFTWRSETVATGRTVTPAVIAQLACPSASECVGVDGLGGIAATTDIGQATPSWNVTAPLKPTVTFSSVSCPSTALCVAVDQAGGDGDSAHVAVSTHPAGSAKAWSVGQIRALNSVQDVSCPTTRLCVIDGLSGLFSSTDPARGAASFTPELTQTPGGVLLEWTSCPSATLCVSVTDGGEIYESSRPAGGTAAWHVAAKFPKILFSYVSCPSVSLCVGLGYNGDVVTSTDPGAADPVWTDQGQITGIDDGGPTIALACTAAGECVTDDSTGTVYATADATGPASGWIATQKVDAAGFTSVTCLASGRCLAPDNKGAIASSSAPAGAAPGWEISAPIGAPTLNAFTGVTCVAASLCLATASGGHVASVRDPGAGHAWHVVSADPEADLRAISCPSTHFCAAIGSGDALTTSSDPTGAASAWTSVTLTLKWEDNEGDGGPDDFDAIDCPSSQACFAPDVDSYDIASSTDPAGGAQAWTAHYGGQYDVDQFLGISCPKVTFCVAVGVNGDVWTQQNDPNPVERVTNRASLAAVSCPTVSFCVATGAAGRYDGTIRAIYTGSPSSGSWKGGLVEPNHVDDFTGVSCASAHLCAAVDSGGSVFLSTDPAAGPKSWHATLLDKDHSLRAVTCPTAALCVAVGDAGKAFIGQS